MALSNSSLNAAAAAIQAASTHAQLHSAAAGSAGTTSPTTAARVAVSWNAPINGDFGLAAPLNFSGGAASGAVYSVTLWNASTAGTFAGEFVLTGDAVFNAAGEYIVTALSLDGSAT